MKSTERGLILQKRDTSSLVELADIWSALGLLTRLPVRVDTDAAAARGADAAWAYPLVGVVVALIAAIVASFALTLGVPAQIAAAILLFVQIMITGAMHEDGLADTADGLWGGWTTTRRLEIMKDSHIGAYGVIALILSLLIRWAALSVLLSVGGFWWMLIAIAALSRANTVALMGFLPNARDTGLSRSVGQPDQTTTAVAAGLAVAIALVAVTSHLFLLLLITALCALTCAAVARVKIGGQTGDILGATQQITEIALLIALAAVVS